MTSSAVKPGAAWTATTFGAAGRQRSGLVNDEGADACHRFQRLAALEPRRDWRDGSGARRGVAQRWPPGPCS